MATKRTLFEIADTTSTGAATVDLLIPDRGAVPNGERWFIQRAAVENETSAFTRVRLGRRRGGRDRFHRSEEGLSAGEVLTDPHLVVLDPGDRYIARFVGTSSGDRLRLTLEGFVKEVG